MNATIRIVFLNFSGVRFGSEAQAATRRQTLSSSSSAATHFLRPARMWHNALFCWRCFKRPAGLFLQLMTAAAGHVEARVVGRLQATIAPAMPRASLNSDGSSRTIAANRDRQLGLELSAPALYDRSAARKFTLLFTTCCWHLKSTYVTTHVEL